MLEALLAWDEAAFAAINGWALGPLGVALFQTATLLGGWPGTVVLALVALALAGPKRRDGRVAAAFVATLVVCACVNGGLKQVVQRPRPLARFVEHTPGGPELLRAAREPALGEAARVGPVWLRTRPLQRRSFPSGHAQHAFAWATFLALRWRRGAAAFVALAALVALSRVVLGVHFPLDVLVGALLGAGFGAAGYAAARRWNEARG